MMSLQSQLKGVKQNVKLAPYTTFKIGGPARFFYLARTSRDIIKAASVAKKLKIPYFILGGGSNLLVSDQGFNGLVIKIQNTKYKILNTKAVAEAGVKLAELVTASATAGLTGLEWAIGIPGTVGGAIRCNAGAFGGAMADLVKSVTIVRENSLIKKLEKKECQFGYRDSLFKYKPYIILEVELELKKMESSECKKKIHSFLARRKETQPLEYASAGCIFKNPTGYSAGQMIDVCGLKGKKQGQAQISPKHANFIINLGGAKASDVVGLIELVKKEVRNKFGVVLEEEIEYLI